EQLRPTVTGTLRGYPVMLQVVDFWPPLPTIAPPVLHLFVARPLEPTDPRLTDTGQSLVDLGFTVWGTRAGVWVRRGSAAALLGDEEELSRIAELVVDLCDELPAGVPAPDPEPVAQGVDAKGVADGFLAALADRDTIRALARTAPAMFIEQDLEPSPVDVD